MITLISHDEKDKYQLNKDIVFKSQTLREIIEGNYQNLLTSYKSL